MKSVPIPAQLRLATQKGNRLCTCLGALLVLYEIVKWGHKVFYFNTLCPL